MNTWALLVLVLVCAGILYWVTDAMVRKVVYFVLIVGAVAWFLTLLGVLPARIHIP